MRHQKQQVNIRKQYQMNSKHQVSEYHQGRWPIQGKQQKTANNNIRTVTYPTCQRRITSMMIFWSKTIQGKKKLPTLYTNWIRRTKTPSTSINLRNNHTNNNY